MQDTSYFWKNIIMAVIISMVVVVLLMTFVPGLRKQLFQYKDLNTTIQQGEREYTFEQGGIEVKFSAAYFHELDIKEMGKVSNSELITKGWINDDMVDKIGKKGAVETYMIVLIDEIVDPTDRSKNKLFTNDLIRSPVEITFSLDFATQVAVYWWNGKEWKRSYASSTDGKWTSVHQGTGLYAVIVEE